MIIYAQDKSFFSNGPSMSYTFDTKTFPSDSLGFQLFCGQRLSRFALGDICEK
jgi:hypothetical protein